MSRSAKLHEIERRADLIKTDQVLIEIFDWIEEIKKTLNLNDREFARELGISLRMYHYYKHRIGHIPSLKTLRKLFEIERLCRNNITMVKNDISFVKLEPINVIVIE